MNGLGQGFQRMLQTDTHRQNATEYIITPHSCVETSTDYTVLHVCEY